MGYRPSCWPKAIAVIILFPVAVIAASFALFLLLGSGAL